MSLVQTSAPPIAKNPSGRPAWLAVDAAGTQILTTGGLSSALNLTAGQHVVKASAGRVCRLNVTTPGTAGTLAVNDAAALDQANASNLVFSIAGTAAELPDGLQFPCANGIVVTVPTGGTISIAYS